MFLSAHICVICGSFFSFAPPALNGYDGFDFGVFQRIKDLDKFKRVRITFDTVEWDCGVDLDPEYIYAKYKEAPTAEAFYRTPMNPTELSSSGRIGE